MAPGRRAFLRRVEQALGCLPEEFRAYLDKVEVVVEDWPSAELLQDMGVPEDEGLYGVYLGTPLPLRPPDDLELPSRIVIFQGPLTEDFPSEDDLQEEIAITLLHEFAHHLGIEDDRLDELGWD